MNSIKIPYKEGRFDVVFSEGEEKSLFVDILQEGDAVEEAFLNTEDVKALHKFLGELLNEKTSN